MIFNRLTIRNYSIETFTKRTFIRLRETIRISFFSNCFSIPIHHLLKCFCSTLNIYVLIRRSIQYRYIQTINRAIIRFQHPSEFIIQLFIITTSMNLSNWITSRKTISPTSIRINCRIDRSNTERFSYNISQICI